MKRTLCLLAVVTLVASAIALVGPVPWGKAAPPQAIEAPLHVYVHCDGINDGPILESADEVYLIVSFVGPDGQKHVVTVGPHDFRDSGDKDRWRDYHRLAVCQLKPGER